MEDHLLFGALHIKHAFVAKHLGAIDIDDGTQKIFQLGGVKLTLGPVDKTLHVVIVMMVMARPVVMLMRV